MKAGQLAGTERDKSGKLGCANSYYPVQHTMVSILVTLTTLLVLLSCI